MVYSPILYCIVPLNGLDEMGWDGQYSECGEYGRVRGEQTNARRVSAQLRALLAELQALRGRVRAPDLPRFDRLTQRSRDLTLQAIIDYLGNCTPHLPYLLSPLLRLHPLDSNYQHLGPHLTDHCILHTEK